VTPPPEPGRGTVPGDRVCYLHIGLHKTASSAVQQMVLHNVERLAAAGIYVPETSTDGYRRAHHELAAELNRLPGGPAATFGRLGEELRSRGLPARLLLTSEDFSRRMHRREVRESLRAFFDALGYRLRVIAYLRPQERAMNSTYAQQVRSLTLAESFDEYRRRVLRENPAWFDYQRLLGPLLDEEGVDCEMRPFHRAVMGAGVEEDFLTAVGVPAAEAGSFVKAGLVNRTPGPRTVAACLEIARRVQARGLVPSHEQRVEVSRRLQRAAAALGWDEEQFCGLTPEGAEAIRAHFASGNDLFSRRAWGRGWAEVFAAEAARPVAPNQFHPAGASLGERVEFDSLVAEVWDWAERRLAGGEPSPGPGPGHLLPATPGQAPPVSGDQSRLLVPVLVLWSARSGSTLLMHLLGTSPLIAFDRVDPYEHPYLLYLVRMARLLDRGRKPSEGWSRRQLRGQESAGFGPFPVGRRAQILNYRTPEPLWARSLRALWLEFSEQARAAMPSILGSEAPAPTMYAEKSRDWLRPLLRQAGIAHHALYLLRDPRDVYLSILAFNAKKGVSAGFGMEAGDTAEGFARRFAVQRRALLEPLLSGRIPAREIVRYEALVHDLPAEAARLGSLLGVELDPAGAQAAGSVRSGHITAGSAAASVGRWKKEMSPAIRSIFARELGDVFASLGWEA